MTRGRGGSAAEVSVNIGFAIQNFRRGRRGWGDIILITQ